MGWVKKNAKSLRVIAAVLGAVLVVLNRELAWGITEGDLTKIVALLVSLILGRSVRAE